MQDFIKQVFYNELSNIVFYIVFILLSSIAVMKVRDYFVEVENVKLVKENIVLNMIKDLKDEVVRQDERWDEMIDIISGEVDEYEDEDDVSDSSSDTSSSCSCCDRTWYDDDELSEISSNPNIIKVDDEGSVKNE